MTPSDSGMKQDDQGVSRGQPGYDGGRAASVGSEPSGPFVFFGALVEPLSIQLEKQGFTVSDHTELMRIEVIAEAVATVTVHGLMSHSASDRARRKLMTRLEKIVRRQEAAALTPSPHRSNVTDPGRPS